MSDGTYAFKVDIELNQENTLTKKELYNIVKSLGPQIVTLDGDTINIRNQGASEYVYGTSSNKMFEDQFNKKVNLVNYIENVIETSNYENSEENTKFTKQSKLLAPDGFDKRTARVIDKSGNVYELNLIIGVNNNLNSSFFGKNFYDISNIKTSALKSVSPKGFSNGSTLHSADVKNSISNNAENVKTDMQIALENAGLLNSEIEE